MITHSSAAFIISPPPGHSASLCPLIELARQVPHYSKVPDISRVATIGLSAGTA